MMAVKNVYKNISNISPEHSSHDTPLYIYNYKKNINTNISAIYEINPYPNLRPFWDGFPYYSPPFGVTSAVWSL